MEIIQEEYQKKNEISSMTTYVARERITIRDMLKELKLQSAYFAVLINGSRASPDDIVNKDDKITILPKIAGG